MIADNGKRFVCDDCGNGENVEPGTGLPACWTYSFPARKPATHHCYECMRPAAGFKVRRPAYSIKPNTSNDSGKS